MDSYDLFYLKEKGKKINYMSYIKQMRNEECNKAVGRVFNNIDTEKIFDFIDEIDCMSKVRKDFYKNIITKRYNIIREVYNKIES